MSKNNPLVSIILTVYNHGLYLEECLESVVKQSYPNIEVIAVDNCSSDNSPDVLKGYLEKGIIRTIISNDINLGICKGFNQGLALAKGQFVIDLSGDDVFVKNRVERQVETFLNLGQEVGVVYSDAKLIDERGRFVSKHSATVESQPSGMIYKDLLARYVICTPTMMIRKSVLDDLSGFDESLAYEDFDFWVRSSHQYVYHYINEVLCKKRVVRDSLSTGFSTRPSHALYQSTLEVCLKAEKLNKTEADNEALAERVQFEMRQAWFCGYQDIVQGFARLLRRIGHSSFRSKLVSGLSKLRIKPPYQVYLKLMNRSH